MNSQYTEELLRELQALPLDDKVALTKDRISEFYERLCDRVFVSFSGGKDSTVLLHIARQLYPDMKAAFVNTGLEYPELQTFVRKQKNVDIIRPRLSFVETVGQYGYPLITKEVSDAIWYARRPVCDNNGCVQKIVQKKRHELLGLTDDGHERRFEIEGRRTPVKGKYDKQKWLNLCVNAPFMIGGSCCSVMKKVPMKSYKKKHGMFPILGTMADESLLRKNAWSKTGCNSYTGGHEASKPMSFWTDQDVLTYITVNNVEITSVYGDVITVNSYGSEVVPIDGYGYFNSRSQFRKGNGRGTAGCSMMCSGCQRTGCIYCAFGAHMHEDNPRFQSLAYTHPQQYEYCMGGGQWVPNPSYDPTRTRKPDSMGWTDWNPKEIWVPSKRGLGMRKVFEICNDLYGRDFIRYE